MRRAAARATPTSSRWCSAGSTRSRPTTYVELREALEKLRLNDSSFIFEPETSAALGFGFRCGFLGLLHMEVIQERLEREYNLNLITTMPSVEYIVRTKSGEELTVDNPALFPAGGEDRARARALREGGGRDPDRIRRARS